MPASYDGPFCQSLAAAPVDAEVARLVLQALEPAAIEVSLAVASDLEAERVALDHHWRQRLERAQQAVDQARRCYASVEPENRLVARTLEKDWEVALAAQARLMVDHDRFQRERRQAPSAAELAAIRTLSQDLPALWHAATTTQRERQEIARLLLERVIVKMLDDSEQVDLECHWHGGNRTAHRIVRPVARVTALSTYPALIERMTELHAGGHSVRQIAAILNDEGWRPPKRRDTYNAPMVRKFMVAAGIVEHKPRAHFTITTREPDEWTIRELAEHLGMPQPTLYHWVQTGRLRYRTIKTGAKIIKLVTADAATIAGLKAIRTRPAYENRLPPLEGGDPPNLTS